MGNMLTVKTSSSPSSPSFWSAVDEVVDPTKGKQVQWREVRVIFDLINWQYAANGHGQKQIMQSKIYSLPLKRLFLKRCQLHLVQWKVLLRTFKTTQKCKHLDGDAAWQHTFSQVLDSFPYTPIERSGISWTLKRETTLPVLHLPMVKCGCCNGVHKVLPQRTVQNHLLISHIPTMFDIVYPLTTSEALLLLFVHYLFVP